MEHVAQENMLMLFTAAQQ
jgi:hypothetical protein